MGDGQWRGVRSEVGEQEVRGDVSMPGDARRQSDRFNSPGTHMTTSGCILPGGCSTNGAFAGQCWTPSGAPSAAIGLGGETPSGAPSAAIGLGGETPSGAPSTAIGLGGETSVQGRADGEGRWGGQMERANEEGE